MRVPLVPGHERPSIPRRRSRRHEILYIGCDASQAADPLLSRWLAELDDDDIDWITAPTAEWGLQLARSRQPQLILLDLGASPSSAREVIRSLRESRETYLIPLVGLSSVECQRLPGLSMYCRRPIQPPEFLAMLRLLLGRVPGARRRLDSDRHAAC